MLFRQYYLAGLLFFCINQYAFARKAGASIRTDRTTTILTKESSKGKSIQSIIDSYRQSVMLLASESPSDLSAQLKDQATSQAIKNTVITLLMTACFSAFTYYIKGFQGFTEFVTGFVVEKSLSVDNLFVFLMLFDYFRIPSHLQNRVLTWGFVGAVVMRGVMIMLGVKALKQFRHLTLLFAAVLLVSGFKLLTESHGHDNAEDNAIIRLVKSLFSCSNDLDGEKFFTNVNGKRFATPLLACLICIELSDFVFAVDSIPAALAVSKDPFIVYSSNIFAIMGLRSLYVLLAQAVARLRYIRPAVALSLVFVGVKMIAEFFHIEISSLQSLVVIGTLLGGGIAVSVLLPTDEKKIAKA